VIFDVHAHCIPAGLLTDLERHGPDIGVTVDRSGGKATVAFDGRYTTAPLRSELTDRELRVETMDRTGIDVQVLASWIDLTGYQLRPKDGIAWSRIVNERLAEEAATDSDRFLALGTIPLQNPEAAANELEYAMSELGMAGVEIATTVDDAPFHSLELDAFWSTAARLGAFVLLHPMNPLPGVDLKPWFMDNMVGRPAETTVAFASLLFSGVFERHPDLTICVVHGGGFVPFQIGRFNQGYRQKPNLAGANLSMEPIEYLRRNVYVDTVLNEPAALRFLVDVLGADRILVGTDFPFEMGDLDPVEFVKTAGIAEQDVEAILSGNASRLFTDE
jgi:aminocarboxymuconate-semialdehyde decarboxylase